MYIAYKVFIFFWSFKPEVILVYERSNETNKIGYSINKTNSELNSVERTRGLHSTEGSGYLTTSHSLRAGLSLSLWASNNLVCFFVFFWTGIWSLHRQYTHTVCDVFFRNSVTSTPTNRIRNKSASTRSIWHCVSSQLHSQNWSYESYGNWKLRIHLNMFACLPILWMLCYVINSPETYFFFMDMTQNQGMFICIIFFWMSIWMIIRTCSLHACSVQTTHSWRKTSKCLLYVCVCVCERTKATKHNDAFKSK